MQSEDGKGWVAGVSELDSLEALAFVRENAGRIKDCWPDLDIAKNFPSFRYAPLNAPANPWIDYFWVGKRSDVDKVVEKKPRPCSPSQGLRMTSVVVEFGDGSESLIWYRAVDHEEFGRRCARAGDPL